MPELPDVEGFRRVVADHAAGATTRRVRVRDAGVVHGSADAFARELTGRTFGRPDRHGKWLVVPTGGRFPELLAHFGMTGAFVWGGTDEPDHRHDRVVFEFDGGALRYRDMRKLTGLRWARDESEADDVLGDLGPDAAAIDRDDLRARLTRSRRQLKPALMDQTALAGLGNLCVDEILWRSRLPPDAATTELRAPEWTNLHRRLGAVLRQSSRVGRVPDRPSWLTGHRDEHDGRCPRCSTALRRGRFGGRATVWCPHCQPG
ncbi:Fpg/Nei family DNA glycosylase [Saccharopolyspora cebuensis]|uniref:Fpg/Nei family DNA glycosylase n=1 Tax=Saccharopolyspora cebuensis TaxID=418759 RepID=A0ABV4CLB7_9PSEU